MKVIDKFKVKGKGYTVCLDSDITRYEASEYFVCNPEVDRIECIKGYYERKEV